MINYQSEVVVNRPVEQVYKVAADVARLDDWTDMTGTHLVAGADLGVGSRIQSTLMMGPFKQPITFEVSEYEPNRRLGWKSVSKGALNWDAVYTFEPQGPGVTRVTTSGELRLNGVLRLLEPLMAGEVKSGEAKELVRFKELVEQPVP
jgi:uncharacterized membrane protein